MSLQINTNLDDHFLNEAQAAEFLKFSPKALQKWRCNGNGPKFLKVSARGVRYKMSDLLSWAEQRTYSSTSEEPRS